MYVDNSGFERHKYDEKFRAWRIHKKIFNKEYS